MTYPKLSSQLRELSAAERLGREPFSGISVSMYWVPPQHTRALDDSGGLWEPFEEHGGLGGRH